METKFYNKKAVIFDLDGTIADTLGAITEAINLTMQKFGFPDRSVEDVRRAIGNGATMLVKRLLPEDKSSDEALVLRVRKCYDEMYALTYMNSTDTYDGIKETVNELSRRGIKIAVFSNKQDEYVKKLTKQYFDGKTISVSRGQTDLPIKPNIAGLVKILDELDVSPGECVFVGDSGVDIQTAKNAEMDFIGVSWGFVGREKLLLDGARVIIDNPNEILDLIN